MVMLEGRSRGPGDEQRAPGSHGRRPLEGPTPAGDSPHPGEGPAPDVDGRCPRLWAEDLLEEEARVEIVEAVGACPGANISQVGRATGMGPGVANYHIQRLAKQGVLVVPEGPRGNQRHCFLVEDRALWEDDRTQALFGNTPLRGIARYVLENPGADTAEIMEAMGCTGGTIRRHLPALRGRELVSSCQFGRKVHHRPLPALEEWWEGVGDRLGGREY